MSKWGGEVLLVTLLLVYIGVNWSREPVRVEDGLPAFFASAKQGIPVLLGDGFCQPGVHHFFDGATLRDVIKMTGVESPGDERFMAFLDRKLETGRSFYICPQQAENKGICADWMPAAQRIALQIPLHPDRMSLADWETLPGVGSKMAISIERDRQNNGDFVGYEKLARVQGIGAKRIIEWAPFFLPVQVAEK